MRIESFGSIWEIDEEDHRYRRWPKQEAPREHAEWSDERAGALQDFVWHHYDTWFIDAIDGREYLVIDLGGGQRVSAPL